MTEIRRDIDTDKIADVASALLVLTLHDGCRAWKGFDWDVLRRLQACRQSDVGGFHAGWSDAGKRVGRSHVRKEIGANRP